MTGALPDILARIADRKRSDLLSASERLPELECEADRMVAHRRDFRRALVDTKPAIIAEIKKASPSKGVLSAAFEPAGIAATYERGGAAALSVLTDEPFFQGSLHDLETARKATALPVLRKDFTLEKFHVVEAAAHGADAVLLIAALHTRDSLRQLRELASRYRMSTLVEVHDEEELDAAVESGAEIIGVNNRDLRTFQVSLETSLRLAPRIPADVIKVSESGIDSAADVRLLLDAGFNAFLVGEHLMRAADPAGALRALLA